MNGSRQVQYKNKSCKHLRNYEQIFKLKLTCYQYHIYIFNIYDIDRHYGPLSKMMHRRQLESL